MEFLIALGVVIVVLLGILITFICVRQHYKNFVLKNSTALKQLDEINKKYNFKKIERFELRYEYDNIKFYNTVSCLDYLTYQLIYIQHSVKKALVDTLDNKSLYQTYQTDIKENCTWNDYGTVKPLAIKKWLSEIERSFLEKKRIVPQTTFSIDVTLTLNNIRGVYQHSKSETFDPKAISFIAVKLNQKNGSFYLSDNIWNSICRVERGKVSNRMRFAIFERDGHRCQICGRSTNDLEIDHIIPISKGGKSTLDNLQTLCHRCNYRKGSNLY